jgi:hypothetical protein
VFIPAINNDPLSLTAAPAIGPDEFMLTDWTSGAEGSPLMRAALEVPGAYTSAKLHDGLSNTRSFFPTGAETCDCCPEGRDIIITVPAESRTNAKLLLLQGAAAENVEPPTGPSRCAAPNVPLIHRRLEIRESHTYPTTAAPGLLALALTGGVFDIAAVPQPDKPNAKTIATLAAIALRLIRPARDDLPLSMA